MSILSRKLRYLAALLINATPEVDKNYLEMQAANMAWRSHLEDRFNYFNSKFNNHRKSASNKQNRAHNSRIARRKHRRKKAGKAN